MVDFEAHFSGTNLNSIEKWERYLTIIPQPLDKSDVKNELVPLYGSAYFSKLTHYEKNTLFFGFIKFQAEVIALFEDFLLVAFQSIRSNGSGCSDIAMNKFYKEEFYHSQAFKHFLLNQDLLDYPKSSFLLRKGKMLRAWIHLISRISPYSILIQGAKAETFSMYYSKYVCNILDKSHSWHLLNQMHLEDESHHIPLGYEFFDRFIKSQNYLGAICTLLFSILFTGLAQFILAMGMWRLTEQWKPGSNIFTRVLLTWKLVKWMVTDFEPYRNTRRHLRMYYRRRKFSFYKILGLIHFGGTRAKT